MSKPVPMSVVMSCYNEERWLGASIRSVLNQTWADYEFIIVDDGSTDGTGQIIERFAMADTRILPISKANTGLADSLNVGIARARGMWIARLDADDLCEPERLARQWHAVSADDALVYLGSGLVLIDEFGKRSAVHYYPTSHQRLVAHLRTARKFPAHSSAFFRRDAFRRVGGYRPRLRCAQDWDLWLRLSEVGRLRSLRQVLIHLRRHSAQISHEDGGKRQLLDSHMAMVSHWLRLAGCRDPIGAEDATEFEAFRTWLATRLEDLNVYGAQCLLSSISRAFRSGPARHRSRALRELVSDPILLLRTGRDRLLGSNVPRQLASEWSRSL